MHESFVIVRTVSNAFGRVPVNSVIRVYMVLSDVIVDITIFRRPFVFSQVFVQVSASLTDVRGLAVAAFDLVYYSLSVVRFALVLNIC